MSYCENKKYDCSDCELNPNRKKYPYYSCEYLKIGYEQGMKDKEKELKEHHVFVSNIPIEDIVLDARKDEREQIIAELEKAESYYRNLYHEHSFSLDEKRAFGIKKAIEIVRGDVNENEI